MPQSNASGPAGASLEQEILRNYFEHLRFLLRRHGPGLADLALARVGLVPGDLAVPSPRLSFDAFYGVLDWLHRARVIPVPGIQIGLRAGTGDFGVFGHALRTARRSGESLNLAQRFFGSAWRHVWMDVYRDGAAVVSRFTLQPSAVCDPVPLSQAVMAMCVAVMRELVPSFEPAQLELSFTFRTPPDAAEYRHRLGCRVRFGQPWMELRQPAEWLERPMAHEAPQPRAALQALAEWQRWQRQGSLAEQIERMLLEDCVGTFASLAEVARRLGLAERTLRLHLAAEGTSFRGLLSAVRLELARRYLERTGLSVGEVAAIVGYGHAASFHRAWRQRYGQPPRGRGRTSTTT